MLYMIAAITLGCWMTAARCIFPPHPCHAMTSLAKTLIRSGPSTPNAAGCFCCFGIR